MAKGARNPARMGTRSFQASRRRTPEQDRLDWYIATKRRQASEDARLCLRLWPCLGGASHSETTWSGACSDIHQALFNHVDQVRGIDVSATGVAEYNRQAQVLGLSQERMFAVQGDLLPDVSPDSLLERPDFYGFDVVVISAALHHIDKPAVVLEKLVGRLNKGGTLLVVEMKLPSDDGTQAHGHGNQHFHGGDSFSRAAQHTVAHHGFEVRQLQNMMMDAGCGETGYIELDRPARVGDREYAVERQIFFAKGKKY